MRLTILLMAVLIASSAQSGEKLTTKELNALLSKKDVVVEQYKEELIANLNSWTSETEGLTFPALLYIGGNDPRGVNAIREFISRTSQGEMSDVASWAKVGGEPELLKLLRSIADGSLATDHKKENRESMRDAARSQALATLAFHKQPELMPLIKQFLESSKWELRAGALEAAFWLKLTDESIAVAAKSIAAAPNTTQGSSNQRDAVIWSHAILARNAEHKAKSMGKLKELAIAMTTAEMETSKIATTALAALPPEPELAKQIDAAAQKCIDDQLGIRLRAILVSWKIDASKHVEEIRKQISLDKKGLTTQELLNLCGYSRELLEAMKPEVELVSKNNKFWLTRWHAKVLLR